MSDPIEQKPRLRFLAARRLKRSRDFERVRREGRTVRGKLLMIGFLPVEEEKRFRIGLVTSRRVGGAVVRNRVRRRLREIVRRCQHEITPGFWIVVIARPGAAVATSAQLEEEWSRLAQRAGLLPSSS